MLYSCAQIDAMYLFIFIHNLIYALQFICNVSASVNLQSPNRANKLWLLHGANLLPQPPSNNRTKWKKNSFFVESKTNKRKREGGGRGNSSPPAAFWCVNLHTFHS